MSQSYEDYERACITVFTEWRKLGASTLWADISLPESYGTKWLRIVRPLPGLEAKPMSSDEAVHTFDSRDDEADSEALDKCVSDPAASISYDIIHSTSYQAPVLYMSVQGRRLTSLNEIYDIVVPTTHRSPMVNVGVMGALTMVEHPITGTPAFFVHPCRTVEAMQSVSGHEQLSPEQYLMLWLGLTGVGVGLSLPVELARSILKPPKVDA